jgi:hypothetical protein
MNTQIEDIVKALKSAREERKALELRLSQITSTEVAIKQELVETYEYLGDFLEGEGIIKKPSFPKIHTATSIPAKAMEAKANEIIERIYSGKESIAEESDKDVSVDMEKDGSVFRRSATQCRGISSDVSGTLYHKGRPLTKLDANLSSLASVDEFNSAFSWTHIKLIKINNLYISGDDLTSIIRSIFTVILKSKSLDRLKLLCKGAGILNKTVAAMERKKVNFIKDDPSVVNVKGSTGNKIRGLVYILRWTNHADMIDGIELYTTNQ